MHILIVGGGLGGLSLAQCLRKQGISFEVFERDEDAASRFQGWAIAIHGIIDQLTASFPSDMPDLKESTNHLAPLDLPVQMGVYATGRQGRLGVQDTPEYPIIRAERRRLRDWLSTNIPIQWNKRVTAISHSDTGVSVSFADGTSATGDMLIGADGINSVVREHLLSRPSSSLLKLVPLAAIIGEVELSGEQFTRQLSLGHSMYITAGPNRCFWNFAGLHHANPDGVSGRHYWMYMENDTEVDKATHWLQTATQQEKLDYVLEKVSVLEPKLREIYELTPVEGVRNHPHIWRDLELGKDDLPAGRVVLMGDAAHAMTPFRGEGGYHSFIDALALAKTIEYLERDGNGNDNEAVREAVAGYNDEMLERGVEAVRNSRNEQGNGKPKTDGKGLKVASAMERLRPMPEIEVVL